MIHARRNEPPFAASCILALDSFDVAGEWLWGVHTTPRSMIVSTITAKVVVVEEYVIQGRSKNPQFEIGDATLRHR